MFVRRFSTFLGKKSILGSKSRMIIELDEILNTHLVLYQPMEKQYVNS